MYLRFGFETKNPGIYDALGDRLGSETFEAIWLSIEGRRCREENYDIRLTISTEAARKEGVNLMECLFITCMMRALHVGTYIRTYVSNLIESKYLLVNHRGVHNN